MATSLSLENDSSLAQGYIKVNGTTAATITTSGITGNLTGNVTGTATDAANGSQLALKSAKAWVNFDGTTPGGGNAVSGFSITVNSGSDIGTWSQSSASWTSNYIGQIFYILSIGGVSGATLGGVNVSTSGIQIISVSGTSATFRLLGGNATSPQTITGNGTSSGFTYITYGIRSSYNVSSITKNGTGDYTVNFATPMADANYSYCASIISAASNNATLICAKYSNNLSSISFRNQSTANPNTITYVDLSEICVQIFGN